jgi:hypothetical protein
MNWYTQISSDLSVIPDFISHHDAQLYAAKSDVKISGNIERNIAALPGITERLFNQLQEVEAVLEFLNLQLRKLRRKHFQKYLEAYNRALTSRDAERYTDGEEEVVDFETLINSVAFLRNQYLGVIKGLESKNFMLGHIVRLRAAGMEDISLN